MKTRILHTEFWKKMVANKAPKEVRLFYSYLLTNSYVNMTGIYELPDEYMMLDTGLTKKELNTAKEWLSSKGKVFFYKDWVKVVDAENYNNYQSSPKTKENYQKEIADVPNDALDWFNKQSDTSIILVSDASDTTPNTEIRNKKPEIGVVKGGKNIETQPLSSPTEPKPKPIDIFIAKFNELFKAKYQVTLGRTEKLKMRLKTYTLDQILQAMFSLSKSSFHRGKNDRNWIADPDFLLRNDEQIDKWINSFQPALASKLNPQVQAAGIDAYNQNVNNLPALPTPEELARFKVIKKKIRSILPHFSMEAKI